MKILTLSFVAAAVAMLGAGATVDDERKGRPTCNSWNWWLECLEGRNLEAGKCPGRRLHSTQHQLPTGRAGFMKILAALQGRRRASPALHEFANPPVVSSRRDDFVVLVWEREEGPADAADLQGHTCDMLRIPNGQVAEHWDVRALRRKARRAAARGWHRLRK
jgi:predicted SnoaL-like aldol condensation-catalyzing enzyme